MIPLKYIMLIAAVAMFLGAGYWYGHKQYVKGETDGRAAVQKLWDKDASARRKAYDDAVKLSEDTIKAQAKVASEVESELRTKIADADTAARELARRLRSYQTRPVSCSVSSPSGTTSEPERTSGESQEDAAIGQATEDVFAACKRDAVRLNGWDEWWSKVVAEYWVSYKETP